MNIISEKDTAKLEFSKMKNALSISLSSRIGTGAVIGVLAAMWESSCNGAGGESIVLWICRFSNDWNTKRYKYLC